MPTPLNLKSSSWCGALAALVLLVPAQAHAQAPAPAAPAPAAPAPAAPAPAAPAPAAPAPAAPAPAAPATEPAAPAGAVPAPALAPLRPLGRKLERDPFTWRYPEFRTSEYIATAIFGGMAIGGLLLPTTTPRWTGTNPIDEGARDAMRLNDATARKTADDISDLTLTVSMNYLAFDAGVVAWWGRGKGSVAYQMAAIDVETIAVTAGVTSVVKGIVARERPYGERCRTNRLYARTDDCETDAMNRSYFSGHTSTTFAAASLTCMHHANLGLYKNPAADAAACAGAFGLAGVTGALRIMSDNHHASDVATGAAIGTLVGFGLPWLLHYKDELPPGSAEAPGPDAVSVSFIPGPTSGTFVGTF